MALVFLCLYCKCFSNLKLHLLFHPSVALSQLLMSQHTWVHPCIKAAFLYPKFVLAECATFPIVLLVATSLPSCCSSGPPSSQGKPVPPRVLPQTFLFVPGLVVTPGLIFLSRESQVMLTKSNMILLSLGVGDKMLVPRIFLLYTVSL